MTYNNPEQYQPNTSSPHYHKLISDELFEQLYPKIKQLSIQFLTQLDPSKAEIYKNLPYEYEEYINDPKFKDTLKESFSCPEDPTNPLFQVGIKMGVLKVAMYTKLLKEIELSQQEMNEIQIDKPVYIISLPRSGSTFTFSLFQSDPNGKTIAMYEHVAPGMKTMNIEGRKAIANEITTSITDDEELKFNEIHSLDDVSVPEEEMFFNEMLGLSMVFTMCLPRFEQYRESVLKRDYDWVYEGILNEMKLNRIEHPFTSPNDYFLMKCATHFLTPQPFFNIQCQDKFNPRIIWIHREPIGNIKSAILLYRNIRGRYKNDVGMDDIQWVNDNTITFHEIMLKNAIFAREQWINENPERKKFIYDVGFKQIIEHPYETMKQIYEYFEMEWTNQLDENIKKLLGDDYHTKSKTKRKPEYEAFYLFNPDDVRKRFQFYYDKFSDYLTDYWN